MGLSGDAVPVPGSARADGCQVGTPRALLNIKHPHNPKYVCHCIPITILLHPGAQDFKFECINQIYHVKVWYYKHFDGKVYAKYIQGIYLFKLKA